MSSHMLREIHEQPDALEKTMRLEQGNVRSIVEAVRKKNPAFVMFVARGSSDNAATYGKYLFEYLNGIPVVLSAPSIVTVYKRRLRLDKGLVIGISQSGEGTDINESMADARKAGAFTIGITNHGKSTLAKTTEAVITLRAGLEKGLAATKTYTAQLLSLMMLSGFLADDRKFLEALRAVPAQCARLLELESTISDLSERYRYMEHCVIIGRGFNYATVKEAALKLMETSYVVAQPFSTADFLHGPIALTGVGFPTFVCAAPGKMLTGITDLLKSLQDKSVETVVFSSDRKALALASKPVSIAARVDETVSPIYYIVPFQFLAHYLALAKGIDPDNPRFLKKVTKTR